MPFFGAMSTAWPPTACTTSRAAASADIHTPRNGDPWADLGLLGLAKSAAATTPRTLALRAFHSDINAFHPLE